MSRVEYSRLSEFSSVASVLAVARAQLDRVGPVEALAEADAGARLVDIRSRDQRLTDGCIPGSIPIERNVLEWRLDPASPDRMPELARRDHLIILLCDEGFQSSLAAYGLLSFGLKATDVVGGFKAWRGAGLPITRRAA